MKLKDLRKQYPQISARSVDEFTRKLKKQGITLEEKRANNKIISLHFKEYLSDIIHPDQITAYNIFMDQDKFKKIWLDKSDQLDEAIIKLYFDLFKEKVKKTSCISCINNRLYRIRRHMRRYVR